MSSVLTRDLVTGRILLGLAAILYMFKSTQAAGAWVSVIWVGFAVSLAFRKT